MTRLRQGELRFLVATDVAARGIDIPDLSHVFQYQPPEDPEAYVHRAGRTGRVGASGTAVTLVAGIDERIAVERIQDRFGIDLAKRDLPTPEDVASLVSERVTAMLEAALRTRDRLEAERMQRFLPLAKSLGESEDQASLVAMLLDDYYQETLHGPLTLPPIGGKSRRSARAGETEKKGGRRSGGGRSGRPRSGRRRSGRR